MPPGADAWLSPHQAVTADIDLDGVNDLFLRSGRESVSSGRLKGGGC